MNIFKNIEIADLGLYTCSTLIISDVHIGYEEALNKQGILVPRLQFDDMMKRMESIFDYLKSGNKKIERIIVNGDLKHEFGTISEQEWRETLKFLDMLLLKAKKVILIKGNHDTILGPIAQKRNVEVVDYYKTGDTYFCHGHKIPLDADFRAAKTVVIGHEHPAITIGDGTRRELFKCFAKGWWKKKTLIAMPSFNTLTTGTDLLRDSALSPFMKEIKSRKELEIFVVGNETYYFGRLNEIR